MMNWRLKDRFEKETKATVTVYPHNARIYD